MNAAKPKATTYRIEVKTPEGWRHDLLGVETEGYTDLGDAILGVDVCRIEWSGQPLAGWPFRVVEEETWRAVWP